QFVPIFRDMARQGRLNKRFFCLVSVPMGNNADTVTTNLPRIADVKLFQGDNWVDHFAYGEGNYGPASDNMVAVKGTQRPEDFRQWGRIAREVAKAGLPMHSHTTLIHDEQITASHLERMRNLGVNAAIQPRATIMGGIFHRVHGDRSFDMPPL